MHVIVNSFIPIQFLQLHFQGSKERVPAGLLSLSCEVQVLISSIEVVVVVMDGRTGAKKCRSRFQQLSSIFLIFPFFPRNQYPGNDCPGDQPIRQIPRCGDLGSREQHLLHPLCAHWDRHPFCQRQIQRATCAWKPIPVYRGPAWRGWCTQGSGRWSWFGKSWGRCTRYVCWLETHQAQWSGKTLFLFRAVSLESERAGGRGAVLVLKWLNNYCTLLLGPFYPKSVSGTNYLLGTGKDHVPPRWILGQTLQLCASNKTAWLIL